MAKAKTAGTREFQLELPYGRFHQIFGGVKRELLGRLQQPSGADQRPIRLRASR